MADYEQVASIKERYEQKWLALEEVTAIGIGRAGDELGIIVSVRAHPEKVRRAIPGRIEGVPVTIRKTGAFNVL